MTKIEYKCIHCGNIVLRSSSRNERLNIKRVFCSRKCKSLYHKSSRTECNCDNCGKKIPDRIPSQIRGHMFCSCKCRQAFHITDPDWREKQRLGSIERSKDPIWIKNNKDSSESRSSANPIWLENYKRGMERRAKNPVYKEHQRLGLIKRCDHSHE